jgi:hypothetical protein
VIAAAEVCLGNASREGVISHMAAIPLVIFLVLMEFESELPADFLYDFEVPDLDCDGGYM